MTPLKALGTLYGIRFILKAMFFSKLLLIYFDRVILHTNDYLLIYEIDEGLLGESIVKPF